MTPHMKWGIAGVIVGLILLGFIPFWLAGLIIVLAIAVPVAAWRMLDESQRRRYREIRRRQRGQLR
jgi:membrane protein implicated in regulation of membrane protease activity